MGGSFQHSVRVPDHLAGDVALILSVLGWDAVDPEPASWGGERAAARDALVGLIEQFEALKLVATRQLTPLDVAATHIDILRRNSESYDAKGRDNVALIVETNVNEARKALFDAISNPAKSHAD